jgi:hypothetical protein
MASYGLTIGSGVTITSGITLPSIESDDYFNLTTLLLPGNGTNGATNNAFLDSSTANSGSGWPITRSGNTTQGTFSPFSQTGWGNYFNGAGGGSGANLKIPASTNFSFPADFTIEFWVYPLSNGNTSPSYWLMSLPGSVFLAINFQAGSYISAFLNTSSAALNSTDVTPTVNTWNHIALVRISSTVKMYVNGTASTTTATNSSTLGGSTTIPSITNSSNTTACYISNFRVVKGIGVYTGNFTPPTLPLNATQSAGININAITGNETVLLTCKSNRFIDTSANSTITVENSPSVQAFSPFNPTASWSAATNGGSGYFDGNGDYLSVASNAAFQLGTGDFSIEAWIYPTATPGGQYPVVIRLESGGYNSNGLTLFWRRYNVNPNGVSVDCGGVVSLGGTSTVALNTWTHVAVTRTGTTFALFVNGTREATTTSSNNFSVNDSVYIGDGTSDTEFPGYISNVRIVKGSNVYGVGTTLTVPTAPLTAISGTSLLLNFTNAGIYDATSKNDLETVGNAQISTTQSKWGGSSMSFDGTGDYLQAPDTELLEFGSGDFTIETWVRFAALPSSGAYQTLISKFDNSTQKSYAFYVYNNAGTYQLYFTYTTNGSTNVNPVANGITVATNTWYHYAVCRSGANLRMFIDGTQVGSTYNISTDSIFGGTYPVQVGASTASNVLNGFLQDTRVTKGYARYTANFTAPTAAFPTF